MQGQSHSEHQLLRVLQPHAALCSQGGASATMPLNGLPWNRSISIEGSSDNPLFGYVQNKRHGPLIHKWVSSHQ